MGFRLKDENDGTKRYKVRLVAKGCQPKKKGIDYSELFSSIVKMTTIMAVLSIVVIEDLHFEQLDVKIAFFHGDLEKEIYMEQPECYTIEGN